MFWGPSELIAVGSNSRLFFWFFICPRLSKRNGRLLSFPFRSPAYIFGVCVCVCVYIRMISHSAPGIYGGPNQSGQSADEEKEKRSRSHLLFSLEILFSYFYPGVVCLISSRCVVYTSSWFTTGTFFFFPLRLSSSPIWRGIDSMRWHDDVKGSFIRHAATCVDFKRKCCTCFFLEEKFFCCCSSSSRLNSDSVAWRL